MAWARFIPDGRTIVLALLAIALVDVARVATARRTEIAGTISSTDFVVPAGTVVTAVRDVTITASHAIIIDGALYAMPGANITFRAPSIQVTGTVKNLAAQVGWWRREFLALEAAPADLKARLDGLLGRTPNYWKRGAFDCFFPPPQPEPTSRGN